MKKASRAQFFILATAILLFAYLSFFGISNYFGMRHDITIKGAQDIRFGIDIRGGVEAVFTPTGIDLENVSREDMDAARAVLEHRLMANRITDNEVFVDHDNRQILVRFPMAAGEHDALEAINELGETAILRFTEGQNPEAIILTGHEHVVNARPSFQSPDGRGAPQHVVLLQLNGEGAARFAEATGRIAAQRGTISIWMDDEIISSPQVSNRIDGGDVQITGGSDATAEWAQRLASQINSGSLPFVLSVDSSYGGTVNIIDATMGEAALAAMLMAALIAFVLLCIIMIWIYKIPGIVACIALIGQAAGIVASVSGFFTTIDSFTLTIPGIAGIILSIGMGVDANVITSERIREELQAGRTIDGAIEEGFKRSWSAILDGNITVVIVSVILMGAFGPPDGAASTLVSWAIPFSGTATGFIYSFGYTLLWGVIMNFIMAVFASRIMLRGISRIKGLRKAHLFGGAKNVK